MGLLIKTDLKEIRLKGVDCIRLVENRDQRRALVTEVMNIRTSWKLRNFFSRGAIICFFGRTLFHGDIKS
jgi:hypothetical protein